MEWQSLRTQEFRYQLLVNIARFAELSGVRRPMRFEPPVPAGDFENIHLEDHPETPSLLDQDLESQPKPEPQLAGQPKETT